MNPRILKKLTKKAEPIIVALGLTRGLTRVVSDANGDVETCCKVDRKHRMRYPSGRISDYFDMLPGTIGYGGMSGYYEPEWDDKCCWSILKDHVFESFTDWGSCTEATGWPENNCPRKLKRNTAEILKYARTLAEAQREHTR